ncbi:unnamed protein product [Protopolystoma xenopodis]|uniref:Uncharacterized protein n=1 Tax=Protopolystoma xenopodis TaxID=117903 RepID=A0A3S5CEW1_9PLAT|nr:unnamed protein product [Protopolystoma xenopodis]
MEILPYVAQVLRIYDAKLEVDIVCTHLSSEPTLMSYVALKMLKSGLDEVYAYSTEEPLLYTSSSATTSPRLNTSLASTAIPVNKQLVLGLFQPDRASLWLRSCAFYAGKRSCLDFISLLAFSCILRSLALLHRLPMLQRLISNCTSGFPSSLVPFVAVIGSSGGSEEPGLAKLDRVGQEPSSERASIDLDPVVLVRKLLMYSTLLRNRKIVITI